MCIRDSLRPGADYDGLRDAALCRAKADWLVGINATRLFSVLYHRTLNIGRVMSPTLALIVQREAEIDTFKPVPFYTVALELAGLTVSGERMADKTAAEQLKEACQGATVTIKKVERKEKSEKPPALYDLTTLQRDANRLLGFTAQQTLDYLQSLYEKKLCTYPRTDSRYLTCLLYTSMRNKRLLRTLSALCLTLVLALGFTVPAFAQGAAPPPAEDTTNDSNVMVEETEKAPPLTPDGNAALVDDFGGNKQLITVTTKAGNYFYILIDRANEDKKTAVHFLNQVDEADLMALMEDGKPKEEPPAVCGCTKKCEAEAVNMACPVCVTDKSKCTGKASEPPAETPEPEKEKPAGLNPAALILLLALLGGGGVFAYLKLVKNKPKTKGNDSLDDYDYGEEDSEEWETEDEESDEPDADGGSAEEDDEDSVK